MNINKQYLVISFFVLFFITTGLFFSKLHSAQYSTSEAYSIDPDSHQIRPQQEDLIRSVGGWLGLSRTALLTFNGAPKPGIDRAILNTLDNHDTKALWFVNCGNLVDANGNLINSAVEILKDIHSRGHLIGNNTYNRKDLTKLSKQERDYEIGECNKLIASITNTTPKYFRAPYDAYSEEIQQQVEGHGLQLVSWTANALDTSCQHNKNCAGGVDQLSHSESVHNVHNVQNYANVQMHDERYTALMLERFLVKMQLDNYTFVLPTVL